jgi:Tfp pilus assembly protein PilZ
MPSFLSATARILAREPSKAQVSEELGGTGTMSGQWLEEFESGTGIVRRPLRVTVPLLVSFSGQSFVARDFTLNLDVGAIYIPTDQPSPRGAQGTIKFRASQFDKAFEIAAEVVHVVDPERASEHQPAGMGLQLIDLTETSMKRLGALIDTSHGGSVVYAIRKCLAEGETTLDSEIRSRPADQKVMLALQANSREIDALIREAIPAVLLRLLDNPRLTPGHVIAMLRNPKLNTRVLSAIHAKGRLLSCAETRFLFCIHLQTMLSEAREQLQLLPLEHLRKVVLNKQIKIQLRSLAEALLLRKEPTVVRRR